MLFPILDYAMERTGGARVDERANVFAEGEFEGESMIRAFTLGVNPDRAGGCGFAHCDIVTARPQSWLQQPMPRIASCSDSATADSWQGCADLRRQQA